METNVVLLDVKKMHQNQNMPTVNLSGKWFLDAGFQPGDSLVGEVFEGALLIRNVKKINEKDSKIIKQKIKA
jgi:hypothetical protein